MLGYQITGSLCTMLARAGEVEDDVITVYTGF
jgi:hypothetical protein